MDDNENETELLLSAYRTRTVSAEAMPDDALYAAQPRWASLASPPAAAWRAGHHTYTAPAPPAPNPRYSSAAGGFDGGVHSGPSTDEAAERNRVAALLSGGDSPVRALELRDRKATRVPPFVFGEFGLRASLRVLDLSRNHLKALPAEIGSLSALTELNVSRNFLKKLPVELGSLLQLTTLNAHANELRCSAECLQLAALAALAALRAVDLCHNKKIYLPEHAALLAAALPTADCKISEKGGFEDRTHAADRDGTLIASQIAPYSTGTLRRRLALVFGETTDPDKVDRDGVLQILLTHYERLGPAKARLVRKIQGVPVSDGICAALHEELEKWAALEVRERPTISAAQYMILTTPTIFTGRRKVQAAERKLAKHPKLWELARTAMEEVDPVFAKEYTAVAFTRNFVGSPHIDTQNTGPFYGLALGDFCEGGGQLCVECSAREICAVDTRHRMGNVDGRFPHWVAPYTGTRYSVIYYRTVGEPAVRTTAVFVGVRRSTCSAVAVLWLWLVLLADRVCCSSTSFGRWRWWTILRRTPRPRTATTTPTAARPTPTRPQSDRESWNRSNEQTLSNKSLAVNQNHLVGRHGDDLFVLVDQEAAGSVEVGALRRPLRQARDHRVAPVVFSARRMRLLLIAQVDKPDVWTNHRPFATQRALRHHQPETLSC